MTEWLAGAALGLAGSAHCVAMCGPLTFALRGLVRSGRPGSAEPRPDGGSERDLVALALYHGGRLAMYAVAGLAAGLAGQALVAGGLGRGLAIGAGIALLVFAASRAGLLAGRTSIGPVGRFLMRAVAALGRRASRRPHTGALLAGVLNAWLPCGLLYAALTAAAGLGGAWQGLLFMTMFGLGTVPALAALWIASGSITPGLRRRLRFAAPVMLLILGLLLIARGVARPGPGNHGTVSHISVH